MGQRGGDRMKHLCDSGLWEEGKEEGLDKVHCVIVVYGRKGERRG